MCVADGFDKCIFTDSISVTDLVVAALRVTTDTCVLGSILVSHVVLSSLRHLSEAHQLAMSVMSDKRMPVFAKC